MTDKEKLEKIRSEVIWYIHLRNEGLIIGSCGDFEKLLKFIDSMQEEPVSEELEEAVHEYMQHIPESEPELMDSFYTWEQMEDAFKAGAKWQTELFEKERLKHCDALTAEQAQIESDFVTQHLKDNNRTPTFIDAIEYGMKMQKEQIMAKAVDGEVTYGKSLSIPSLGWMLDKEELDFGKKVKLIIIKEG